MSSLYNNKNFIFSISIKILYLFVFLSFFYIIIKKQVKDHLSDNISTTLSESINNKFKENSNENFQKYTYFIQQLYKQSIFNNKSEYTSKTIMYNKLVFFLNITFIIFLIILPVIIYYITIFVFNKKIPIIQILIFNLFLYIIVGIIEYIFFINIASKYIPITNGDITNIIKNYFI
jgi:hypothetical protein